MNISRYILIKLVIVLFGFVYLPATYCQDNEAHSFSGDLSEVLTQIELSSDYIFNYAPDLLSKYRYEGSLNINVLEETLNKLLYRTPFEYTVNGSNILIYQPEQGVITWCGTIYDDLSKAQLGFVNIYFPERNEGIQSDSLGKFNWSFKAYKDEIIQISHVGYIKQSYMVQEILSADCLEIYLEIDPLLWSEEIIVKGYILSGITEGNDYGSIEMDNSILNKNGAFQEFDVLRTVQLLPGISTIDESVGNLQIRGSTPDQNLVVWEGATLYDPGHVFGMISSINPFIVDHIDVYKGAFSPEFDNRVGGLIDISLDDSIANKFVGGVGTTMTEFHTFIETPVVEEKMSLTVAGRKTIDGLFRSPTLTSYTSKVFQNSKIEDQQEEVIEGDLSAGEQLDYYDLNFKLSVKPSERIKIHTSFFRSRNDFTYSTELVDGLIFSDDEVLFKSSAWSTQLEFDYAERGKLSAGFSVSEYNNSFSYIFNEIENGGIIEDSKVDNGIEDYTFQIKNEWNWSNSLTGTLGYNRNRKKVQFNFRSFSEFESEVEDVNNVIGDFNHLYGGLSYSKKSLKFDASLKYVHLIQANSKVLSPRFNLQYALNTEWKLKSSGGIFQQYISQLQQFGENDLGLNNRVWVINDSEGDESFLEAKKIALGILYEKNGWLFDLEGYWNNSEGLTTLSDIVTPNIEIEEDFDFGSAKTRGFDVLLKKSIRQTTTWANYSYGKVDYLFPKIKGEPFPASNDQRHTFSLIQFIRYNNFNFSLNYQIKSGLPFSRPVRIEEIAEGDDTYFELSYDGLNQERLPHYQRLDIGVNYKPTMDNLPYQLELNFTTLNLLNRQNLFSREYYLADLEDTDGIPEWYDIERRLLNRTFLFSVRMYW